MSYQSWPDIFPAPSIQFSGKLSSSVLRTKMETGRVRQRRRFTNELRAYSAKFDMDDFQFGMFQSWLLHQLNGGADFFYIDLPTGGAAMKTVLARFQEGQYGSQYDGVLYWHVSATLEVEDALVFTEDEYTALYPVGSIVDLEAAAAALHAYTG